MWWIKGNGKKGGSGTTRTGVETIRRGTLKAKAGASRASPASLAIGQLQLDNEAVRQRYRRQLVVPVAEEGYERMPEESGTGPDAANSLSRSGMLARHLCPVCPSSAALAGVSQKRNYVPDVQYCCPRRQTVTRVRRTTVTRKRVHWKTKRVAKTKTQFAVATRAILAGRLYDDLDGDKQFQFSVDSPFANRTVLLVYRFPISSRASSRGSTGYVEVSRTETSDTGSFGFVFAWPDPQVSDPTKMEIVWDGDPSKPLTTLDLTTQHVVNGVIDLGAAGDSRVSGTSSIRATSSRSNGGASSTSRRASANPGSTDSITLATLVGLRSTTQTLAPQPSSALARVSDSSTPLPTAWASTFVPSSTNTLPTSSADSTTESTMSPTGSTDITWTPTTTEAFLVSLAYSSEISSTSDFLDLPTSSSVEWATTSLGSPTSVSFLFESTTSGALGETVTPALSETISSTTVETTTSVTEEAVSTTNETVLGPSSTEIGASATETESSSTLLASLEPTTTATETTASETETETTSSSAETATALDSTTADSPMVLSTTSVAALGGGVVGPGGGGATTAIDAVVTTASPDLTSTPSPTTALSSSSRTASRTQTSSTASLTATTTRSQTATSTSRSQTLTSSLTLTTSRTTTKAPITSTTAVLGGVLGSCDDSIPTMKNIALCDTSDPSGLFGGGSGNSADPYLISNATHLANLAANQPYWDCAFKQTANITLTGQWPRIGPNTTSYFSGSYEGQGYTVKGLIISTATSVQGLNYGLFGVLYNATVFNLRVEGTIRFVFTTTASKKTKCGLLAGRAITGSVVYNVQTSGSVQCASSAGGLLGELYNNALVLSSSSSATIVSDYDWYTGGLIGVMFNGGTLVRSFATGSVTGTNVVGGLVGSLWPETTAYAGSAGAIIIKGSYATGFVNATAAYAGGLVGQIEMAIGVKRMVIDNCWASGNVVSGSTYTGGLVGMMHMSPNSTYYATISNSYAIGSVDGGDVATAGGLLGMLGQNTSANPYGFVYKSYWNPTDSGTLVNTTMNNLIGTQSTQAAMKGYSLYSTAGWSISNTDLSRCWGICNTSSVYPFLSWTKSTWPC